MLVHERMSKHPITVTKDTPISEIRAILGEHDTPLLAAQIKQALIQERI